MLGGASVPSLGEGGLVAALSTCRNALDNEGIQGHVATLVWP